jgi:hypothetical protein
MQAARERSVRSPLLEAGLSKSEIRALSQQLGLPTWDQPSAPCLSSRLPYGLAVTPQRLREVERAEEAIRALGFRDFRVRHHGNAARVELPRNEIAAAHTRAAEIAAAIIGAGFDRVLLDIEGYRRGALNESLVQIGAAPRVVDPHHDTAADASQSDVSVNVSPAGHDAEIAVLDSTDIDGLLRSPTEHAASAKQLGYKYAAIDITDAAAVQI